MYAVGKLLEIIMQQNTLKMEYHDMFCIFVRVKIFLVPIVVGMELVTSSWMATHGQTS